VAPKVFDLLEDVTIRSSPPAIMADNYESAVSLLNDFASAGSVGAVKEQTQDTRTRRGQQSKQSKPQSVNDNISVALKLTLGREDAIVSRSVKAVSMIYQLTSRIPVLMQRSHLESKEGK
jgi:brefeldin A-resistance guanine nucleotide exchange factor 1